MLSKNPGKTIRKFWFIVGLSAFSFGLYAQDYTTIFVSTDINEWDVDGRVSTQMVDSTLAFVFSFDDENPPLARPDTVILELANPIDLTACDSVFIKYSSRHYLPTTDSWVAGDVRVLVSHPYNPDWVEIYDEDLSHLAGWVSQLDLQMKVAVRSSTESPGAFYLYYIRFIGKCSP